MWKMGPMSGVDIRPVYTLPPRDSTLQLKRCVHLWNNFPCIITLACIMFSLKLWVVNIKILMMSFYTDVFMTFSPDVFMIFSKSLEITNKRDRCAVLKNDRIIKIEFIFLNVWKLKLLFIIKSELKGRTDIRRSFESCNKFY